MAGEPSPVSSRFSRAHVILVISTGLFCLFQNGIHGQQPPTKKATDVAFMSNSFGLDLFRAVGAHEFGNILLSPLAIASGLGLAYAGAKGTTATAMQTVLRLNGTQTPLDTHEGFRDLYAVLKRALVAQNLTLSMANRIQVKNDLKVYRAYTSIVRDLYNASIVKANFSKPSKVARNVNRWVAQQTRGIIKNFINEDSIQKDTILIILSAIYFKGGWLTPFDVKLTKDAPFYVTANSTVTVPLMSIRRPITILTVDGLSDKASIVELPYQGNIASMILIVPKSIDGLPAVEAALNQTTFQRLLSTTGRMVQQTVMLPRFNISWSTSLTQKFSQLGLGAMFDKETADFQGITNMRGAYWNGAIQHASISVNEEGTEAAALFAMIMAVSEPLVPIVVRADRPFLFIIREKSTNAALFLGRVKNPTT